MGKLLISVEVISHKDQRYPTCGDWTIEPDGSVKVFVSDTGNDVDAFLVGIHEIVEAFLCRQHGVLEMDVNAFDIALDLSDHDAEPGEHVKAPYHFEHAAAEIVERTVALQAGIRWKEYSDRVDALFDMEVTK